MNRSQYNSQDPYEIVRRIMQEEMHLNWTCDDVPQQAQPSVAQSIIEIEPQEQNPEIQYIGKLTNELKDQLDAVFQLSADTNQWTKDTISSLIEIQNKLEGITSALNYAANLNNTAAQTTTIIA